MAAELGLAEAEVGDAYRRLHDAHALVLDPGTRRIRMLNPFSAVETPHPVESGGRSWFGNCAWDALGIPAALHADGRLDGNGWQPGATMNAGTLNELAQRWWSARLAPDWRPRPPAESQRILDELGLTGEFWRLG